MQEFLSQSGNMEQMIGLIRRTVLWELLEEYPDFQITIIDTKCASMGFGLVVYKCLRMQENGAPKDLIIEAAQYRDELIKLEDLLQQAAADKPTA